MRILATLLVKEFKQIFRNKLILPFIFVVPVVQMILLTYAANLEMKGITMAVVDQDHSQASRLLISRFEASPFFEINLVTSDYQEAVSALTSDHVDVILHMRRDFEKGLYSEKETDLQLVINAINTTDAGLTNAYCTQIIADFNGQVRSEWFGLDGMGRITNLEIIPSYWYNPLLDFKIYMFSGILVIIVTLIGMLLTALNLVKREGDGNH